MDSPRVEPDQVEAGPHLSGVGRVVGPGSPKDHVHPRGARAPRVEEERPDSPLGIAGGDPDQRQADLRPTGAVVVKRYPERGALQVGRDVGVACMPAQPRWAGRRLYGGQRSGDRQQQRYGEERGGPTHGPSPHWLRVASGTTGPHLALVGDYASFRVEMRLSSAIV